MKSWFANPSFEFDFKVLRFEGLVTYFCLFLIGSIACSFVLRWTTSDSYNLPRFENKKRLHFVSHLSDAGATSYYRIREAQSKKT